jgi:hypothetical protein
VPASPSQVPQLAGYGQGVYRRRIRLEARRGRVVGELQDDFHHFALDLAHDGSVVCGARGGGLRVPWTTCGGSILPLERLQGLALTTSLRAAARHTDPRLQCTHLFDLATLAVAHAARGTLGVRCYDVSIPDRKRARTRARLNRDGVQLLEWEIDGNDIVGPEAFAGRPLSGAGFARWAEGLGEDLGEAAWVLRRAAIISIGRRYDFERMTRAAEFGDAIGGACHTFSPDQVSAATRNPGTRRDFGDDPSPVFVDGFSASFREFDRDPDA